MRGLELKESQRPDESVAMGHEVVVARMARRDDGALAEFYDAWYPLVYAIARSVIPEARDVEDVMSDVFWQAWSRCGQRDVDRASVQSWITSLARTRTLEFVRDGQRSLT